VCSQASESIAVYWRDDSTRTYNQLVSESGLNIATMSILIMEGYPPLPCVVVVMGPRRLRPDDEYRQRHTWPRNPALH
jgi:hypothetical protein